MMILWMLYWIGAASALAIAALIAERVLRWNGRPARAVWIGLLVALLMPVALLVAPPLHDSPLVGGLVEIGEMRVIGGSASPEAASSPGPARVDSWLFALWLLASATILLWIAYSAGRLTGARGQWSPAVIRGRRIWLSREVGPAVAGVLRPVIVLPRWIEEMESEAQEMMLAHEEEHLRAGDTRLLLAGCLLVALVPWNPVSWWGLRRLRQAIEADCDRRVLKRGYGVRQYADTLLHVAGRAGPTRLALSLGERTENLERRLRTMTMNAPRARVLSTGAALAAILAIPAAVWALPAPDAPMPAVLGGETTPAATLTMVQAAQDTLTAAEQDQGPSFIPHDRSPEIADLEQFTHGMRDAYPRALRDAGVGGTVILWLFVDDQGAVADVRVEGSSGQPTLDDAAMEVARATRFTPAKNQDQPVAVWVQFPVTFATD